MKIKEVKTRRDLIENKLQEDEKIFKKIRNALKKGDLDKAEKLLMLYKL